MKKLLCVLALLMGGLSLWAQVEHRVVKYSNGMKRYEGDFVNDYPVGEFRRYHENGQLSCLQVFDENHNSTVEFYTGSGKLLAVGQYEGRKRTGEWKFYSEEEYLFMIEHYEDGLRVDETLVYMRDGKIIQRVPYRDGKINGERIHYYPYGNVLAKYTYKDGVLDGPYSYFYETGQPNEEGAYLNGKAHGVWRSYAEDGSFEEVEYIEGEPAHPESYNQAFQEKLDSYDVNPRIKDPQDYINNPSDYFSL